MRKILALCLGWYLLAPAPALAVIPQSPLVRSTDAWASGLTPPLLLSAVACNAAAAALTWTSHSDHALGYGVGAFQLDFTRSAATALTVQIKASLNGQSTWATIPACDDTSDGTCTLMGSSQFSRTVSGSENFIFRADFLGAPDVQVIVSCTGGGANDKVTLYGRLTQ